jgi:5-hydroxyisourate hydrolase-like protein (transthyretin family)
MCKLLRHVSLLLFSLILIASAFAREAVACSCAFGGGAPCQEYWKAEVIFAGTVVGSASVELKEGAYKSQQRLVKFSIGESFRGIQAAQAEVITGWGGGDCGYGFQNGETYLVYARRGEKDTRLYTSICTRTRLLTEAAEDLDYFRSLPGADARAIIFGRVTKRNHYWKEGENISLPISSAELIVEGNAGSREAQTDAKGNYRVTGLTPGAYKVKLKLPEGLVNNNGKEGLAEGSAEVVERGCAEVNFYLDSDTRVSGRVVDAVGQPAANIRLEMRGASPDASNINTFLNTQADAEGRFEFKMVPPGDYLLGVNIMDWSSGATSPYPRTYYPGVALKEQAGIIRVKEGERLSDIEMRLPPRPAEYSVEGFVVWSDGRPAPGVKVYLSSKEEGGVSVSDGAVTDERGRFTLKLYEGLTYTVSASSQNARGKWVESEKIEVLQSHRVTPVKIVLPIIKK